VSSLFIRFSAAFALTAATACLVIGLLVYEQTESGLFARARDAAAQEARKARDTLTGGPLALGAQFDTRAVPGKLVAAASSGRTVATMLAGRGSSELVWAAAHDPAGATVYVSESLAKQEHELSTLRSTLLLAGAAATAVAALLGIALAAWLSARLRRAAGTARRIAAGQLADRVRLDGNDEVAALAHAIDEMADSLEARIARERRFAADAAHELRTPLAAVVASSQLLPESRAAAIVQDGVGRLRRLVDQLLELARLEGGLDAVKVDQVDLQHVALAAQAVYPGVLVESRGVSQVATDLRRLERIVANLVENALCYGSPPVTIHVEDHALAVSDRGPGFAADLIPHVAERFTVGDAARSQGVGLGLSITAEHARALDARLEIANRPAGGAIVTVTLTDLRDEGSNGPS
jgi:signal transduction histidine kinase